MTARSDAVVQRSFQGRRRVSDVARDQDQHLSGRGAKRWSSGKVKYIAQPQPPKKRQCTTPCGHLDYGALVHVLNKCEGISRLKFGSVCKLWRRVFLKASTRSASNSKELQAVQQEAHEYDTIYLAPGMYKRRVLCDKPLRFVGMNTASVSAHLQQGNAGQDRPGAVDGSSVIFWQERSPAIMINTDAACLSNVIVRVLHASHEYSSVAYGPAARAVTLQGCRIMGGTGIRVPYSVDPLKILLLNLQSCEIQDIKSGLSGVTAISGQLIMDRCSVHDCTYGVEVGVDGHACIRNSTICFTECALMVEGHVALTGCHVWGNGASWHGRPLVMEDDADRADKADRASHPEPGSQALVGDPRPHTAQCTEARCRAEETVLSVASCNSRAGICNGRRDDCVAGDQTGVRHHAQLRLNGCIVEYERLKSGMAHDDGDLKRHNRAIRCLMHHTYGPPDQDFEDWQVVAMSDLESDGSEDADVVMNSEDEDSDDMVISSDDSSSDDDSDGSSIAGAGVESSEEDSEDATDEEEDATESGDD